MSVLSALRAFSLRAAALSSARSLVLAGGLVVLVPASAQAGRYRNASPSPADVRIELTSLTAGVPDHGQRDHKGAVLASGVVPAQPGSAAALTTRAPASPARWLGAGVYLLGWMQVVRRIALDQLQVVRQLVDRKVQR